MTFSYEFRSVGMKKYWIYMELALEPRTNRIVKGWEWLGGRVAFVEDYIWELSFSEWLRDNFYNAKCAIERDHKMCIIKIKCMEIAGYKVMLNYIKKA